MKDQVDWAMLYVGACLGGMTAITFRFFSYPTLFLIISLCFLMICFIYWIVKMTRSKGASISVMKKVFYTSLLIFISVIFYALLSVGRP